MIIREFFCYISDQVQKIDINHEVIYITHLERVLLTGSANTVLKAEIEPNHEEADTRMLIHALPFFHALTGCDTMSAIAGSGKNYMGYLKCISRNYTYLFSTVS